MGEEETARPADDARRPPIVFWLVRHPAALIAVEVALGCCLVLLAVRACYGLQYGRLVRRARDAGQPVTPREVLALVPDVPDERNAAVQFRRAEELARQNDAACEILQCLSPELGTGFQPDSRRVVGQCLKVQRPALDLAYAAARLEPGSLTRELDALGMLPGTYYYIDHVADALHAQAILCADAGDWEGARRALSVALAAHTNLSGLERADVIPREAAYVRCLEHVLSLGEMRAGEFAGWHDLVPSPGLEAVILSDYRHRANLIAACQANPRKLAREWGMQMPAWPVQIGQTVVSWYEAPRLGSALLDSKLRKLDALGALREGDWTAGSEVLCELEAIEDEIWELDSPSWIVSSIFGGLRVSVAPGRWYVEPEIRRRVLAAALACEEFRLRHGRWPGDLSEVAGSPVPELYRDPLTDRPLDILRTYNGIMVRALGWDGRPHGGLSEQLVDRVTTANAKASGLVYAGDVLSNLGLLQETLRQRVGRDWPVDPLTGRGLQISFAKSGGVQMEFDRPAGPLVVVRNGEISSQFTLRGHYLHDIVFRLLDPAHRGTARADIVECLRRHARSVDWQSIRAECLALGLTPREVGRLVNIGNR